MSDTKQLALPITGMTCANCVGTVERNLKKLDGVQVAAVESILQRASVEFDPTKLGLSDLIGRVDVWVMGLRPAKRISHQAIIR